ncbi:MAG: hypothetical protein A2W52_03850 [Candidatus Taylorbacteria bacterium RIFCSPHIGHO2_02_49_25]|uniref:Uncharacterized protein n=2 Tax=Parcubacteria group TaxID=1794811 RepID=A0A1F6YMT4_9BACT|nr:MAG: hypothetical protein A2225_02390 [Candidatus Nomurabacteria bacterium RIFOXYA2_FULL_42_12]OHA22554.1 MAG: hypothetical protein A2W52_03850 [Candidatus Taylorbacteria bacterium RIFCSPHIGHO2_02_49_25]OHA36750.1 MAG: hypothetical protein A2W65_01980 [Candidatus Taylorbacteria bacterium RIFCSPLOWO2_02_50_13]OHA41126.1 MAG: hypothetical protein A3H73_02700 [Candidatus Taylorbacteria bacterium RIFCSPLOWO2_02_FULL_50_120]OHA47794.1 MAG: hypothetical protein A3G61_03235 [Candidatus Taylorbacter
MNAGGVDKACKSNGRITWNVMGNSKLQIPNHKQITNSNLKRLSEVVPAQAEIQFNLVPRLHGDDIKKCHFGLLILCIVWDLVLWFWDFRIAFRAMRQWQTR